MDTHNLLTLQYAFVKGHIHISNSNKLRDFTHATLSPYGKHHACPHTTAYIMYRMTPTVFSWGTQQQWQQFLMTTYMTSLCSRYSTQRPPDCSLSAWQMCTPHGCTERDWRSLEQIGHLRGCAGTSSCSSTCVDCSLKSDLFWSWTSLLQKWTMHCVLFTDWIGLNSQIKIYIRR